MKIKALSSHSFQWLLFVLVALFCGVNGWSNEEFEMFDLVEEVGQNFYEVLGIPQDAGDKDIRSAYRKLSVKIHPDKNPAEDAEVKFRQLVGIYEVLKNKELRESYHQVLIEGLPNWRQPMFYFRRARRLALWQVGIILLGIVSLGQVLAGWASYFEKRLSMKEQIEARLRKTHRTKRGQKEGPTVEELEAEMELYLPKPSLWNLAPFQILRGIKYLILQFPKDLLEYREQLRLEKEEQERLAALEQERLEKEKQKAEEPKKPRKRKTFQPPELPEGQEAQAVWNAENSEQQQQQQRKSKPSRPPPIAGGLWTDDDLAELARLCSKFPGGTPERWETIADLLNRPVPEVTFMAKKVLEKLASKPAEEVPEVPQVKSKVKTKGGKADAILAGGAVAQAADSRSVENWSAEEQKALEQALQSYPKGAIERWDKVAKMVPNRSKEECMARFKYVAELVKKKKEKENPEPAPEPEPTPAPESLRAEPVEEPAEEEPTGEDPGWQEPKKSKKAARKAKKKADAHLEPLEALELNAPEPVDSPIPEEPEPEEPEPVKPEPVKEAKPLKSKAKPIKLDAKPVKLDAKPIKLDAKPVKPDAEPAKAKAKPEAKPVKESEPTVDQAPAEKPTESAPIPVQVAAQEEEKASSTPLVEVDTVESQLQSLVEESFTPPETPGKKKKQAVSRTDSKSSSEGSESVEIIPSGRESEERTVDRRKSSESSENDWCVVESNDAAAH